MMIAEQQKGSRKAAERWLTLTRILVSVCLDICARWDSAEVPGE